MYNYTINVFSFYKWKKYIIQYTFENNYETTAVLAKQTVIRM